MEYPHTHNEKGQEMHSAALTALIGRLVTIVPYAGTEGILDIPHTPQVPNEYWANMLA